MQKKESALVLTLALSSMLLQSSGLEKSSALHLRQKKPMPPQLVDFTQYDDVIELDCVEKPNYITFKGTQMTPVVRVRVVCRCDTKHNQFAPETKYEDLWFKGDLPIGSKQYTVFPIADRHKIGIFLKNNPDTLSDPEITACANALVRLRLEATMNRNLIATVRIPSYSFERMKIELQKRNFVSFREHSPHIKTLIPLPLESDLGRRETMCFHTP